jgi:hypothetical protein
MGNVAYRQLCNKRATQRKARTLVGEVGRLQRGESPYDQLTPAERAALLAPIGTAQASDEQSEAEYAGKRCDEQELLDRYPGLLDKPDDDLIDLVGNPPALMADADEVSATAAVILERRLSGLWPSIPAVPA